MPLLLAFASSPEPHLSKTRAVYRLGNAGSGVVLSHEVPTRAAFEQVAAVLLANVLRPGLLAVSVIYRLRRRAFCTNDLCLRMALAIVRFLLCLEWDSDGILPKH